MNIRISLIVLGSIAVAAPSARAQGHPQQQVVASQSVLKSMIALKPKTKTPLSARIAVMRRPAVAHSSQASAPPATVKEISKTSRK